MNGSRHHLGAIATDLLGSDRATRRVARLERVLAVAPRPALTLEDLAAVPTWLRRPVEARRALAHQAALLGIAPALARSIDGRWLGALAAAAGDATLDRVRALGESEMRLPVFAAHELDGVAAGIMRANVPARLADYAAPAVGAVQLERSVAAALIARADAT